MLFKEFYNYDTIAKTKFYPNNNTFQFLKQ